jgi:hypothetical protein
VKLKKETVEKIVVAGLIACIFVALIVYKVYKLPKETWTENNPIGYHLPKEFVETSTVGCTTTQVKCGSDIAPDPLMMCFYVKCPAPAPTPGTGGK